MNAGAQTAKVYVSSQAGDRLAAKPELKFTERKPTLGVTFEIDDAVHFQKMDGFGASFMEAGIMGGAGDGSLMFRADRRGVLIFPNV